MKFTIFFKNSFYLFAVFAIFLTFLTLAGWLNQGVIAAWVGLLLAWFNFLIGAAILAWGAGKTDRDFYGAFFSGMILRFILIFVLLWFLITNLQLNSLILAGSLLISYFGFLFLEIWLIHKHSVTRSSNR
ncbi:MAG: hypothetical protein A2Y94_02955 [Caldithrix sp. RBG_13_44_9]|nr:MAG: hypothetical protein A2Y94_02955 [Caldithrix sp. RBG_13_44_9]